MVEQSRARRLAWAYTALAEAEDNLHKVRQMCHSHMVAPTEIYVVQVKFDHDCPDPAFFAARIPELVKKRWLDFIEFVIVEAEEKHRIARSAVVLIESEINK